MSSLRRWTGWYRHITLALLTHTLLAILRQAMQKKPGGVYRTSTPGAALTDDAVVMAGYEVHSALVALVRVATKTPVPSLTVSIGATAAGCPAILATAVVVVLSSRDGDIPISWLSVWVTGTLEGD